MSINWLEKYRLTIKRPIGARKSFDIILDTKSPTERTQVSIRKIPKFSKQAESLAALNLSLKSQLLSENDVEVSIKNKVIPEIEKILGVKHDALADSVIGQANEKVLKAFLTDQYANRKIVDKQRLVNAFEYALKVLDNHSLASVDLKTLQRHWDKKLTGTAHRRYGRCINTLMKFLGRDIKLQLERNSHRDMRYPSLDEVIQICAYFPDDKNLRNLIMTMFCTGTREGETFALTTKSLRANTNVYVDAQIDRNLVRREIKNRNKHNALIIPEGLAAIKEWSALPQAEKNEYRFLVSHRIAEASLKVLERRLSSHDMRHGYSVHLLDKGIPLDRLAQFLGDTLEVTQKHYASFIASDYAIQSLSKLLKV